MRASVYRAKEIKRIDKEIESHYQAIADLLREKARLLDSPKSRE